MDNDRKCIHCGERAIIVDKEYDEPYCQTHFDEQQASTEPIEQYTTLSYPEATGN